MNWVRWSPSPHGGWLIAWSTRRWTLAHSPQACGGPQPQSTSPSQYGHLHWAPFSTRDSGCWERRQGVLSPEQERRVGSPEQPLRHELCSLSLYLPWALPSFLSILCLFLCLLGDPGTVRSGTHYLGSPGVIRLTHKTPGPVLRVCGGVKGMRGRKG